MWKTRHRYHLVIIKSAAACSFFGAGTHAESARLPGLYGNELPVVAVPRSRVNVGLRAPACDFRKLPFRPGRDHLQLAEIDLAAVAVDGDPIASRNAGARQLRTIGGDVDRHVAAADDAGLAHLARDQGGMGGAGADGGDDAGCGRKASHVGRRGVRAHQDHRIAHSREPFRAWRIEGGTAGGDAA